MSDSHITPEQLDLVERFLSAYNAIQKFLSDELDLPLSEPFYRLIDRYGDTHSRWERRDGRYLRGILGLRNALVHDRVEPNGYLAVPLQSVVVRVEAIYEQLVSPLRAIPTFGRRVATISADDTLARALQLAARQRYSQLPVYDHGRFAGLLTENGVTRWLAQRAAEPGQTGLDLEHEPVSAVLEVEEQRHNVEFAARDDSVDQLIHRFVSHPTLEAVLITEHGLDSEGLLGIATRWDIVDEALA